MTKYQAFFFLLVALKGTSGLSNSIRHLGITLPAGTSQIEQNRFVSSRSYAETLKEMRQRFMNYKHISQIGDEINLPHVRATSFVNTQTKAAFSAINIYYNTQTGVTEIYFVSPLNKTS